MRFMLPQPSRLCLLLLVLWTAVICTPAQSVARVGLRSVNGQGRFLGLKADSAGNLYTLLDAGDGVRLIKMDAGASTILAETDVGQAGDFPIALALDADGNVYVAGTSLSNGSVAGTAGTSFPARADSTTNSFLAKFSPTLTEQWLTFLGSGRMAVAAVDASSTQVVVTGSIFAATLPVTPNGIQQQPLPGSFGNGFVEGFNPADGTLRYSTYLSGANGDTTPAGVALDAAGNVYIVGSTDATGFPTLNALVPDLLTDQTSPVSGFLSKLTPAGDAFLFSTYIPGNGLTSVASDNTTGSVLIGGNIAAGLFPDTGRCSHRGERDLPDSPADPAGRLRGDQLDPAGAGGRRCGRQWHQRLCRCGRLRVGERVTPAAVGSVAGRRLCLPPCSRRERCGATNGSRWRRARTAAGLQQCAGFGRWSPHYGEWQCTVRGRHLSHSQQRPAGNRALRRCAGTYRFQCAALRGSRCLASTHLQWQRL